MATTCRTTYCFPSPPFLDQRVQTPILTSAFPRQSRLVNTTTWPADGSSRSSNEAPLPTSTTKLRDTDGMLPGALAISHRPPTASPLSPPLPLPPAPPPRPNQQISINVPNSKPNLPRVSLSRPLLLTSQPRNEPLLDRRRLGLPAEQLAPQSWRLDQHNELHELGARRSSLTTTLTPSLPLQAEYSEKHDNLTDADSTERESDHDHAFPPLPPTAGTPAAIMRKRKEITAKIRNHMARFTQNDPTSSPHTAESEANYEHYSDVEIQGLWMLLKQKRQQAERSRVSMAGNRKQLRDLRRRKDEADNAFMGLARRLIASSQRTELDALSTPLQIRFQEMQLLRTDYHTKETEYEGLEVDLDQLEEDSNRLEIRFFRTLAMADITTDNTKGHHLQAKAEAQDSVGMRSMLMGILPDRPSVEVHPLWTDLSDAIAEMNIAQEEVEDILLAQQELTYDLGLKERTNRTVSARELELLRSFRADEQAELARLAEATTRVRELYNRCVAEAAPYEDPPYHIAFALGLQTDDEIILDDSTSDTEETFFYRRYPALLSQPHHLLGREPLTVLSNLKQVAKSPMNTVDRGDQMRAAFKEYEISHLLRDTKAMNKTDYINRWLLQYLRISPLQVEILAAAFTESTHLQIVDKQRWELDVLFQWWRDEAAIRSVEHISQRALTATVSSSAHGPKDGFLFLGSSHSSQIRGMASEPPNNTFAKHDIWESRSRLSGHFGSEAASDVLHLGSWSEEYPNKASAIMSDFGPTLETSSSTGG